MEARAHLGTLVGKTVHTITQGRPNRILEIDDSDVLVATDKSPAGQRVPITDIQAAIDMLERAGELRIDVNTVGYRSAFIGAVLAALPDAVVTTRPSRVRLNRRGATERP